MPRAQAAAILTIGFVLGFTLMGFEMVASRYLYPYYGSGIEVWAALISTVLLAVMAGSYLGGQIADRRPDSRLLGAVVLVAALLLVAIPLVVDPLLNWLLDVVGDGVGSVIAACVLLLFLPLTLVSFFSPFAVRMLLQDAAHGGRVSGAVYAISTIGNVAGTLATSLVLIPMIGSRAITLLFAAIAALCGLALFLLGAKWGASVAKRPQT